MVVNMCNKLILAALLVILCSACNHSSNNAALRGVSNPIRYHIINNIIEIITTDSTTHTINIAYPNKDNICTKLLSKPYKFIGPQKIRLDIDSIIRCSNNRIELSYKFFSNPKLPLVITIDEKQNIDFEYKYFQKHIEEGIYARLISGNAAYLIKEGSVTPDIKDIRRWLYNNNNYIDNDSIDLMYEIFKDLSYCNSNNFYLEDATSIPTIKDFSGIKYRINTNMVADYYYLFATDNKWDLETFISDVVSDNFIGSLSNTNNAFSCYRSKDKGGLLTIFLIGIDKKWNKQIIPIGMVSIDNEPPYIMTRNQSMTDNHHINVLLKMQNNTTPQIENEIKCDTIKTFKSLGFNITGIPHTDIEERITVRGNDFRGGYAEFTISFSKNVKSITFEYKDVKQKLDLTDKESPYTYSCNLPLNLGDNYIKINAEDILGNMTKSANNNNNKSLYEILTSNSATFYVKMVRREQTTPDININLHNNVDVNVW